MYPVLWHFGPVKIFSWGFMLALAVLIAIIGIGRCLEREGLKREMAVDLVLLCIIGGVLGGRIAYIITYEWVDFLRDPLSVLSLHGEGIRGLVWYGSLVGGLLPFIFYVRRQGLSFWKLVDIFAPFLALGYAVVRVGCFLAGCCYGAITSSQWGMVFPTVDGFYRYPTQLYSSALNLMLFAVLFWLYPRRRFPGQVFSVYIIGYAVYRFVVEFFRDSLIMIGPLSLGQVYTFVLLLVGIGMYYYLQTHFRNGNYDGC